MILRELKHKVFTHDIIFRHLSKLFIAKYEIPHIFLNIIYLKLNELERSRVTEPQML